MSFASALVDRGRTYTRTTAGRNSEGRKEPGSDVISEWFACRLTLPQQSESVEGGRTRGVTSPTLMVDVADEAGGSVTLRGEQTIEIVSDEPEIGTRWFEIQGDPEPVRKRTIVIGWEATGRVVER